MSQHLIKWLAVVSVVIFCGFLMYLFLIGIKTQPTEGDSIHIHIPLAKAILSGHILHPQKAGLIDYPAATELILAVFIAFHLPINIFNVFALSVLFGSCYLVGKQFQLTKYLSLIFATSICLLYGILRYANNQKIDIWLLIFFIISLLLLEQPRKKITYFFLLGLAIGMLFGSKFSGPFYAGVLVIVYGKQLLKFLSFTNALAFIIPCSLFGLSWYLRNYINTGDPFYPQNFLFFRGDPTTNWYSWQYWQVVVFHPIFFLNAMISEFMVWSLSFLLFPISIIHLRQLKQKIAPQLTRLCFLSLLTTIVFLFLPPPPLQTYTSVVFGMRYGFPAVFCAVMAIFAIAKIYKKELLLTISSFVNITFLLLPLPYHPKYLFFYVPIVSTILFVLQRRILFVGHANN